MLKDAYGNYQPGLDSEGANYGSGSGSSGGGLVEGDYGGGQPDFTPASGAGIAVDNSNGHVWLYYGGQWNG